MNNLNIELQTTSHDIWASKYQLKDKNGVPVDKSITDTFERVADALAAQEDDSEFWKYRFMWALSHGATPAGRIMANLGAAEHKPAVSTINCTVSGILYDSIDDIMTKAHEAALTLKAGCGIGYEFSTLRPKGAFVAGAGANTSGPLSFADIYDKMCFTVSSAGGRRGAQMMTFDVHHPDIVDLIRAKREDGKFRQFNISLLITELFMNAVIDDLDWHLSFPVRDIESLDAGKLTYRPFPTHEGYTVKDGLVACEIYETIKAKELWDIIMQSTYDFAEPGFILIDAVNKANNNWFCEDIRATNPCGEQPLPPYGACLLGSINLTTFVVDAFTPSASFDFKKYKTVIEIFTRMLDNVVELNGLPLGKQREEILRKRRHGMGYLGLGSAMTMLNIVYGSEDSLAFTEKVTKQLAIVGWQTGVDLAIEKGKAPIFQELFQTTDAMRKRGDMVGTMRAGNLFTMSGHMQQIEKDHADLVEQIRIHGCRFTHHSSIAPTGTIALSLGNNCSNGIEPSFAHQYSRNVIVQGKKSKEKVEVYSYELLAYRALIDPNATHESDLPEAFITADSVDPKAHVDVQAAAQKWIDSSISKTINVPTDIDYEDFKDIYLYAYEKGLKGCTTFRFNPEAFQGVLVKEDDLSNTTYEFTLEDGSKVAVAGNEIIQYDGEEHTAANLFDAMKEGYYGKL